MPVGTVTSKGQITIPLEVRVALGLHPGSRVDFIQRPDGIVELHVDRGSVRSLKGLVPARPQPVTLQEMDEAIAAGADPAPA